MINSFDQAIFTNQGSCPGQHTQADFEKANRLIEATDWTFLHNETNVDLAWDIREKQIHGNYVEMHSKGHHLH